MKMDIDYQNEGLCITVRTYLLKSKKNQQVLGRFLEEVLRGKRLSAPLCLVEHQVESVYRYAKQNERKQITFVLKDGQLSAYVEKPKP